MTHDRVSINIEINLFYHYVVVAHFAAKLATCAADTAIHYFKTCVSFRFLSWLLHRIFCQILQLPFFVTSQTHATSQINISRIFLPSWFFSSHAKNIPNAWKTETDLSHLEKKTWAVTLLVSVNREFLSVISRWWKIWSAWLRLDSNI